MAAHFDTKQALGCQSLNCNRTSFVVFNLHYTQPFDPQETNKVIPMTGYENQGDFV